MEVAVCKYRDRVIGWLGQGPDGNLRYVKATSKGASCATLAAIKFQKWAIERLGLHNIPFTLRVPSHD